MGGCGSKKQPKKPALKVETSYSNMLNEAQSQSSLFGQKAIKLCLTGQIKVGKSQFFSTFFSKNHIENTPINGDYSSTNIQIDGGKRVSVTIWDTAGQEEHLSITKLFYNSTQGIILLYDILNPDSFEALEKIWIPNIEDELDISQIVILVLANKIDLSNSQNKEHEAMIERGRKLAADKGFLFQTSNAKNKQSVLANVRLLLNTIVDKNTLSQKP